MGRYRTNVFDLDVTLPSSDPDDDKRSLKFPHKISRLNKRKRSGLIRFFDLGQFNIGTKQNPVWSDLDFEITPIIDVSSGIPSSIGIHFTLDNWDSLKTKILEIPLDDFSYTYRQLTYEDGEKYYIDLYLGDPTIAIEDQDSELLFSVGRKDSRLDRMGNVITGQDWSRKGLNISKEDFFTTNFSVLFAGINKDKKITKTPVYSDPEEIDFKLSKQADIYLVPQPVFNFGGSGNDFSYSSWPGYLNMYFGIASRKNFLYNDDLTKFVRSSLSETYVASVFKDYNYTIPTLEHNGVVENSLRSYLYSLVSGCFYRQGTGYVAQNTFPHYSNYEFAYSTYDFDNWPSDTTPLVSTKAGALTALIYKDKKWYYVWQTVDDDTQKQIKLKGSYTLPPPPPDDSANAPPPIPIILSFPTDRLLLSSPGSGVPFLGFRRCYLNIIGGYVSGPWFPQLRQIQILKFGLIQFDVTANFTWMGWGIGSYFSTFVWVANRIFRPDFDTSHFHYVSGSSQTYRVRDKYQYGGFEQWSTWAEISINFPSDCPTPEDNADEIAYLEAHREDGT
jgi:hypothetical protein